MKYAKWAAELEGMNQRADAQKLRERGVEPYSQEAMPLYAAWTREDIATMAQLTAAVAEELRWIRWATLACAAILLTISVEIGRYLSLH